MSGFGFAAEKCAVSSRKCPCKAIVTTWRFSNELEYPYSPRRLPAHSARPASPNNSLSCPHFLSSKASLKLFHTFLRAPTRYLSDDLSRHSHWKERGMDLRNGTHPSRCCRSRGGTPSRPKPLPRAPIRVPNHTHRQLKLWMMSVYRYCDRP